MSASQDGTVIHRADAPTLPPLLQPAWKATPARGGDRFDAMGGHMFSPIKLQRMFHTPSVSLGGERPAGPAPFDAERAGSAPDDSAHLPFTFRAGADGHGAPPPSSTPAPPRQERAARPHARPPSTPGGLHVPLRLLNLPQDVHVRTGLEQLVEEPSNDLSDGGEDSRATTASSLNDRVSKRLRIGSHAAQHDLHAHRAPLAHLSANTPQRMPSGTPLPPRSILKSGIASGMRRQPSSDPMRTPVSRSISFADAPRPRARAGAEHAHPEPTDVVPTASPDARSAPDSRTGPTPRTVRLDRVLAELEHMNLSLRVAPPEGMGGGGSGAAFAGDPPEAPRTQCPPDPARTYAADRSAATNVSFRATRDKMVELLTDVAPWAPDWARLSKIDLRARRLESCIGLGDYLPNVEQVWLDHNAVAFTMGLPASVRILTASSNRFTELASFEHLRRLEVLDVSRNELGSLLPFAELSVLRELRADGNAIRTLDGLARLSRLQLVSLAANALEGEVDLAAMEWPAMQQVRLSQNRLTCVDGVASLHASLRELDVDTNALRRLAFTRTMPLLRVLRVSENAALDCLDVAPLPRLRTLYADRCRLASVHASGRAAQLQRLSLRSQRTPLQLPLALPASLERLFLAGNALTDRALLVGEQPALVYLELAGCQLRTLPHGLAQHTPMVRTLNVDHNPLTALPALAPWPRLKRLSAVGCRLGALEGTIRAIHAHTELCVLDTRTNPCTLGLYPPLFVPMHDGDGDASDNAFPPVPNPAIVQPDMDAAVSRAARMHRRAAQELADRSHFHKRAMIVPEQPAGLRGGTQGSAAMLHRETRADMSLAPLPPLGASAANAAPAPGAPDPSPASALYCAADARFEATLPRDLAQKRSVYRGLCGMACATLVWLDGLLLADVDVRCAERQLERAGDGRSDAEWSKG
ncbi:hypothetical protein MSPP1_001178 [Malassezia sp. CBS 17886]|nr:hypothetical protein MSPP1_001178 [Malassezia sp. CBS 17886]